VARAADRRRRINARGPVQLAPSTVHRALLGRAAPGKRPDGDTGSWLCYLTVARAAGSL
jgi:hypothetical protein